MRVGGGREVETVRRNTEMEELVLIVPARKMLRICSTGRRTKRVGLREHGGPSIPFGY